MKRLFSAQLLVLLASGCGSREGEYKPAGQPALKFEVRSASTVAVEGWQEVDGPHSEAKRLFLAPLPEISNADVASTGVEKAKDETKSWIVSVWLTDSGKPKLAKLSKALVEPISQETRGPKRLAIFLDGKVVSAPLVKEELSNGRIWIQEDSEAEARRIAKGIVSP